MEYTNSQIKDLISEFIHSERDREVLCYRLIHGLTLEQICLRYQQRHPDMPISVDTIKRILRKNEPVLFRHIPG